MKINEETFDLEVSQWDYGVPVVFELDKDGFLVGDKIVFVFDIGTEKIEIPFDVNENKDPIELVLTKIQSEKIINKPTIPYSIKHYRNNKFLDTLVDAKLKVRKTIRWTQN